MKYLRKGGGEPKEIYYPPIELDTSYKRFSDFKVEQDRMIIDNSAINLVFIILGGFLSIVSFFYWSDLGFNPYVLGDKWYRVTFKIVIDILFISFVFMFFQGFLGYKKVFIFDRLNGTLTYPEDGWFRSKTIPFDDACFILTRTSNFTTEADHIALARSLGITTVGVFTSRQPERVWAMFVWYMDRNRPLPPGKAFDPYRQQDYERRKAAGFPKPLYPAYVDISNVDFDGKDRSSSWRPNVTAVNPTEENKGKNFSRKKRKK